MSTSNWQMFLARKSVVMLMQKVKNDSFEIWKSFTVHLYVCMYVCMYVWMYEWMYVCMCKYGCVYGCVYICVYVCMYECSVKRSNTKWADFLIPLFRVQKWSHGKNRWLHFRNKNFLRTVSFFGERNNFSRIHFSNRLFIFYIFCCPVLMQPRSFRCASKKAW
jgi:hypothetical protein